MKRWDIGHQVMFATVLPAALVALALAWYFTYVRVSALERELREHGAAIARQMAPATEYGVFSGNSEFLRQLADTAVRDAGVDGVAIFDKGGSLLAHSGQLDEQSMRDPRPGSLLEMRANVKDALVFVAPIGRAVSVSHLDETGGESLGSALPLGASAPAIGAVVVQMSLAPLALRKRELILAAIAITLGGLGVAVGLARRLGRGVTRPVLQLAGTVDRIKGGDLGARSRIEAGGVIMLLESGINDMAASLEGAQRDLEKRVAAATADFQKQKELAEQANRTKTQFLAAASHDLRQPIQAVGLFVSALRLRSKDEDTQRLVSRIERALAGLEAVLDGLLDISRLDSGAVTPRIETFPVARLLNSLREAYGPTAAESRLELRVRHSTAWCQSDPLLLERVISNLVSNALRYTAHGGVVVGCRRAGDGGLRLEVWDSGNGIPLDKRTEIFREFVQLDNPQGGRDKGLGLGLAIVERLSRLLGHPVTLHSRVGRGTCFCVSVPRARAPAQAHRAAPMLEAQPADFGGMRILAVDDDPDVLESLVAFLSQVGATVVTAASLAQARDVAGGTEGVDAVLTDYRLPDGDGLAVVEELRRRYGAATPGIIITGETSEDVLHRVRANGLPLLQKPVPADTLHQELQKLLRGRATP